MKLDELARDSARRTRAAARSMPVEPIHRIRRRRLAFSVVPALGAAAAVLAVAVIVLPLPGSPPPVAESSTTTTAPPSTTTTQATTTTPATTVPPPAAGVTVPSDLAWIQATYPNGVVGSDGAVLADVGIAYFSIESIAWDGADGIVYLSEDTPGGDWALHWSRPDGDKVVLTFPPFERNLADVVWIDGRPLAALFSPHYQDGPPAFVTWIDLATGTEVEGPAGRIDVLGDHTYRLGEQGRWASIEEPDWSDIERGEIGEPLPPFPLPHVVISDEAGSELLRFEIGNFERPYVTLHDFDGRRLIVSIEPFEPAAAPRTVWIIDLECPECTERIDAGPDSFDLVGVLESTGSLQPPLLP